MESLIPPGDIPCGGIHQIGAAHQTTGGANQFHIVRLGTKKMVDYAHRYNIAVQYWTINDPDEIERLNDIGADAIISDTPDVAYKIIKE